MPVGIVKTPNRVPENAKGMNGRASSVCHDGHMMCPIKPIVDEDAKVSDNGGLLDSIKTGAGGPWVDRGDEAANKVFSSVRGSKRYKLSLIHVTS